MWNIARKKDSLWIQWVHTFFIKNRVVETVTLPTTALLVVRKTLSTRDLIIPRQDGQSELMMDFAKAQKCGKFSTKKMNNYIMPNFTRVEWNSITLQRGVHQWFKLWLVVQKTLAIVEKHEKFGIQVSAEYVFCSNRKETFEPICFDCQVTKTLWERMCIWIEIPKKYSRLNQD